MSLLKVTSQRFAQTIVMITHNEEIAQMALIRLSAVQLDGQDDVFVHVQHRHQVVI